MPHKPLVTNPHVKKLRLVFFRPETEETGAAIHLAELLSSLKIDRAFALAFTGPSEHEKRALHHFGGANHIPAVTLESMKFELYEKPSSQDGGVIHDELLKQMEPVFLSHSMDNISFLVVADSEHLPLIASEFATGERAVELCFEAKLEPGQALMLVGSTLCLWEKAALVSTSVRKIVAAN